jgi:hypothetical protein
MLRPPVGSAGRRHRRQKGQGMLNLKGQDKAKSEIHALPDTPILLYLLRLTAR